MIDLKDAGNYHRTAIRKTGIISADQAIMLKAFGIIQRSRCIYLRWLDSGKIIISSQRNASQYYRKYLRHVDEKSEDRLEVYSAFNFLEIGTMLTTKWEYVSKLHPVVFRNGYRWHLPEYQINEQTETTGRAALLIYLLQNKIIAKEEVNSLVESHEGIDSEKESVSSQNIDL